MKSNVVAIIGARKGSKGLPGKNIKLLAGKPLIAYTIEAAKDAKLVDRIIVSTDDEKIAMTARKLGAEVPFIRPTELATDYASSESFLKHAIEWIEKNENYRVHIVVYLQLTDLFRKKGMIDMTVKKLLDNPGIDSCFVAYKTHKKYWKKNDKKEWVRMTEKKYLPRQKAMCVYREDTGIACATRTEIIKKGDRIGDNVEIIENEDRCSSIDIHDADDFWIAEQIIKKERKKSDSQYYL